MSKNARLLETVKESFRAYLDVGTSRSTKKLKILHGAIAEDLQEAFGQEYTVQSLGYGSGKESSLTGRYYDKKVDIVIRKDGKPVAGYAIKFVMRNYSQNSNNYFESMLGETVNLRENGIPYFQIFITFDKLPHYKTGGVFAKWDILTEHNMDKYVKMSRGDTKTSHCVPDKTLVALLALSESDKDFANDKDYRDYYLKRTEEENPITYSKKMADTFGDAVILNDYGKFIEQSVEITKNE